MLGIDIVKISRVKNASTLAKKILAKEELALYKKARKPQEFLAGRFAAKEAFLKAKHCGITSGIKLNEIKVLYQRSGAPVIVYQGEKFTVSIAHDGDYAIAVVSL
ncbi:MAG: holo-ACP synthase [Bacilli bacterium]|nr:holo-ACP synthase [Bacilli bacterium]